MGLGGGFLVRGRLGLVLLFPFVVGHAVDDLAGLGVGERDALRLGGLAVGTALTLVFLPALCLAWFRMMEPETLRAEAQPAA